MLFQLCFPLSPFHRHCLPLIEAELKFDALFLFAEEQQEGSPVAEPWMKSRGKRCRRAVNFRRCRAARRPEPETTRCPALGRRPRRLRARAPVSCRCASSSTDSRYLGWWGWRVPVEGRYCCTNNSRDRWESRLRCSCIATGTTWRLDPRLWFRRDILVSGIYSDVYIFLIIYIRLRYTFQFEDSIWISIMEILESIGLLVFAARWLANPRFSQALLYPIHYIYIVKNSYR